MCRRHLGCPVGCRLGDRPVPASDNEDDYDGFDFVIITVPTPLKESLPDLSYIEASAREIGRYLRVGGTVVLESTTYPGTTQNLVVPILEEASQLQAGRDFHVGYSPEKDRPRQQGLHLQEHAENRVGHWRAIAGEGDRVVRQFRDCSHRTEPGCAVAAAIDAGDLDPARFASWVKLQREVARVRDRRAGWERAREGAALRARRPSYRAAVRDPVRD